MKTTPYQKALLYLLLLALLLATVPDALFPSNSPLLKATHILVLVFTVAFLLYTIFGRGSLSRIVNWYAKRGYHEEIVASRAIPAWPVALVSLAGVLIYATLHNPLATVVNIWWYWLLIWATVCLFGYWYVRVLANFVQGLRKQPIVKNDFFLTGSLYPRTLNLSPSDPDYSLSVAIYGIFAVGALLFVGYLFWLGSS